MSNFNIARRRRTMSKEVPLLNGTDLEAEAKPLPKPSVSRTFIVHDTSFDEDEEDVDKISQWQYFIGFVCLTICIATWVILNEIIQVCYRPEMFFWNNKNNPTGTSPGSED